MSAAPEIISLDVDELRQILERTKKVIASTDYALLRQLAESYVELLRLVRERGTTIARLRRLFGLAVSERTADVLERMGDSPSQPDRKEDEPTPDELRPDESPNEGVVATPTDPATEGASGAHEPEASPGADPNSRPKKKGHGRISKGSYSAAKVHPVPHESLRAGFSCPCCPRGRLYQIKDPASIIRIFGQPPLAAHRWDLERLRCSSCTTTFTAAPPEEARGERFDEAAASMSALTHYGAGTPFNRAARIQRTLQTPIPASTQWELVSERAELVRPAFNELLHHAAQGALMHHDDTHMPVLALMGKRRTKLVAKGELPDSERTGMFTTGIVSVVEGRQMVIFITGRSHGGENVAALLERRAAGLPLPILMNDALSRNEPVGHEVQQANCLSHGRRGVVDEAANFPNEVKTFLEKLKPVFINDAYAKKMKMSDQERLRYHQRESGPVLGQLKKWMNTLNREKKVEPNSGLGKALKYMRKHWKKLTLFLRVPGAPLTNNVCERALKMAIIHRKNSYFYRSLRGAEVGDIYMSLIHTAELNGENAFDYLTELQRNAKLVAQSPREWLPWNYRETLARMKTAAEAPLPQAA
jgi:transposase